MKKLMLSTAILAASTAFAAPLKIEADGTYTMTNAGAGSETAANFLGIATKQLGPWMHAYRAEAAGTGSNEHYLLSALIASEIAPKTQFFAKAAIEKDIGPNVTLDFNSAVTIGLAYEVFKTDLHTLRTEAGVGNRFYKADAPGADVENEVIGTLGARYDRKLNENLQFTQELAAEMGDTIKTYRSRTALSAALTTNISGVVSHSFKRDDVSGAPNSDSNITSFGVKYKN